MHTTYPPSISAPPNSTRAEAVGPGMRRLLCAQADAAALGDPHELRRAAQQVKDAIADAPEAPLLAVSAPAERLLGALLMLDGGTLHGADPNGRRLSTRVLLIEAAAAGPLAVARAASLARSRGADTVDVVVYASDLGGAADFGWAVNGRVLRVGDAR